MGLKSLNLELKPLYLVLCMLLCGGAAFPQLKADFTMDNAGGCSPLLVNFTNRTSGASANAVYSWDFGNTNHSALTNPAAVFTDEKAYTVTLTVTDGANTSTATKQVNVYSPPTIDFSVAPTKICLGNAVTFTANATPGSGSISYYTWDYGDGTVQRGYSASQSHVYPAEILASVSVTVTNSYGCHTSAKKSDLVKIIPALTAGFTADKKVLCLVTDGVQFTNSSTGPGTLDYTWNFGDGTSSTQASPSHVYSKKGNYPVSMTVHSSEGCTATANQPTPLNVANYTTDFSVPSPICKNVYVSFSDQSSPSPDASNWTVDGNPTYGYGGISTSFSVTGDHTITLNNTYGTCPQSKTKTISVKDLPYPNGFDATIMGKCGSPVEVDFNDKTAGAVKWEWDFNYYYYNGNITATTKSPAHTYTADGPYTIFLRVTNADGCTNTTTQSINITRPTVSIVPGAAYLTSCYTVLNNKYSYSASEALTSTKWSFGDGGTSTDPNPTHAFKNSGYYTVTLSYTTVNGCTGSTTYTQYYMPAPSPVSVSSSPNPSISCALPLTVSFTYSSTDPLVSTKWSFGDGGSSTDPNPTHTYQPNGHYSPVLTYTTQAGCTGTVNAQTVVVDPKITGLDFSFKPNPVCGSNIVSFTTTANLYDINSYNWDFGDGGYDYSGGSPTHRYGATGTYTIRLYARNMGGCDTTMTKTIVVNPPFPMVQSHVNTCDGTRGDVTFTQTSVQATTVTWNFGDGTTATTPGDQTNVVHTYKKSGTYSVSITATNGSCTLGYAYPYPVYVLLKQSPKLTSSKSAVCSNTPVDIQIANFDKNPYQTDDQYSGSYYTNYYVTGSDYGDGTAFTGYRTENNSPRWTTLYKATIGNFVTGEKSIRFRFKSYVFGCDDTTNFIPLAIRGVTGGFQVVTDQQCYQSPVVLKDISVSTSDNKILSWQWDFGDGQSVKNNAGGTVTHVYASPGLYTTSLQITDAAGCSANTPYTNQVVVKGPKAAFSASGTDVHLNTTVYFYNSTNDYGNTGTVYTWDFGDGTSSTDFYPSHTYTKPGTYVVTMRADNASVPCGSAATPVTIVVRNFNSHFQFNSSYVTGYCPPALVNFSNTSYDYQYVTWDFGDGVSLTGVNYPSHVYLHSGTFYVTLYVYGYNGLTGKYVDSVIITDPVITLGKTPAETCIGRTVILTSTGKDANTLSWDFGDGTIIPTPDGTAVHQYLTAGNYKATLLVTNTDGCLKDTSLPQLVRIRENPSAEVKPTNPLLCVGSSVQLQAAAGSTVYAWSPSLGLSNSQIGNPVASPVITSTYKLVVTDDIGCQDSSLTTIKVQQHLTLAVSPDDTVCFGEISKLLASGEDHYQWINNTDGLSDVNIPNPIAQAPETITYTVKGWDDNNCFVDEKSVTVLVRPLPTVNAGPDVVVEAGYNTTLTPSFSDDVVTWRWTPEKYLSCYKCISPLCTPLATTAYVLTVTNQYACKARDTVVVNVDCQETHVRIPNAFTPNGNGENDVFMLKGISIVVHMVIYSRWGEKVYERDNFIAGEKANCWDGTYKGQKCAPGTYVYYAEMQCPSGGTFTRKGTVILIR